MDSNAEGRVLILFPKAEAGVEHKHGIICQYLKDVAVEAGITIEVENAGDVWKSFEEDWNGWSEEDREQYGGKIYDAWTAFVGASCMTDDNGEPTERPMFNLLIVPSLNVGMATRQIICAALEAGDRLVVVFREGTFQRVVDCQPWPGQKKVSWQDGFECELEDLPRGEPFNLASALADLQE